MTCMLEREHGICQTGALAALDRPWWLFSMLPHWLAHLREKCVRRTYCSWPLVPPKWVIRHKQTTIIKTAMSSEITTNDIRHTM